MVMTKTMLVVLFVLLFVNVHFGQKKEISGREFADAVQLAQNNAAKFNRRMSNRIEELEDQTVTASYDWFSETLVSGRTRWIFTRKSGDKTLVTEQIEIGKINYCRENRGPWLLKKCSNALLGMGGNTISERYSTDKVEIGGQKMSHYVSYTTSGFESDPDFEESEVWIDSSGRIDRRQGRSGSVRTGKLSSRSTTTYLYDPQGLKIEAPIK